MKENGWLSEEVWLADRKWLPLQVEEPEPEGTWVKAVVDLHKFWTETRILEIVDLKSGRRYPEHEKQLQLYALLGIHRYEGVKRVDVSALYIDEGGSHGHRMSYLPEMFDYYALDWQLKAQRMFDDQDFLPTPSRQACKWCSFKASKGGPCQEGDIW